MADNCDRFGPRRSSEDLENDRNKMLEKEKLSTKTIQRRTNAIWNMKRRGQSINQSINKGADLAIIPWPSQT